ncbi:MAG: beta-galactosidase [Bacteroidales bacterium]|nr:beta-galactosidase [Bacteroidales bacterium]
MKHYSFLLLIIAIIISSCNSSEFLPTTENLNREWTFFLGDVQNAESPDFDDSQWLNIGLPHSFAIPYFMSRDFYVGYGWYRKKINLDANDLKNKVFIEFDGVFQEAEIFVNGKKTGSHIGGYTGFSIDITDNAKSGENVIAVRVNNNWRGDVAPRAGEHNFNGGIYRSVRLIKKNPVHFAWCGLQISTPELKENNGKSSKVLVNADIQNQSSNNENYQLKINILDANKQIVSTKIENVDLPANSSTKTTIITDEISNPNLWSVSNPNLYTIECQIINNDKIIDTKQETFGFRWIDWTADHGIFLNGEHIYLHGANVHQDHAGWCDAVVEEAIRRDVRMIKEAGFNMIRGSHYPHSPVFADECSRQGILFWSEAPFWGTGGNQQDGYWYASAYPVKDEDVEGFEKSVIQQLEEMIIINRNQPSIFAWSMCNEVFFTQRQTLDATKNLLKKMVNHAHTLDTRYCAIGGAQRPLGDDRIDLLGDAVGYNGDGATIPDFIEPGIPSLVSEYSTTTAIRPGVYDPGWADLVKNDAWKGIEWRGGQCIWCGFDHGSIFGSQLGKTGIIDYFRIPKRSWYWYRNEYTGVKPPEWPENGIPSALKIEATKVAGIKTDGTDDIKLTVKVLDNSGKHISNSPDVKLTIISGPGEFPTGQSISFSKNSDIPILDGECAIEMRAYYAGKTIVEASSDGLNSAQIELEFVGDEKYVEGVSPKIKNRPYVQKRKEFNANDLQILGTNNPTFTSSNLTGHSVGMGADGDENTYWSPATNDNAPQWVLDTERSINFKRLEATLGENNSDVTISISNDGGYYVQLAHYNKIGSKIVIEHNDLTMRFIKFNFGKNQKPQIKEVKVYGWLED